MTDEDCKPDAVMIPTAWKGSDNAMARALQLVDHAERMLGTDRMGGEKAYVRLADGSHHFASHSPHDTLNFPSKHARSGQPRYRWINRDDGSTHGFLVDDEARRTTDGKP